MNIRQCSNRVRTLTLFPVLLVAFLVLVACQAPAQQPTPTPENTGATGADETTTPQSQTAAPEAEDEAGGEAAFPVTIEHKYGSTTVSKQPERVIALGYQEQDAILALGVKPIAVRYWFGEEPNAIFPWAQDELQAATVGPDGAPEVLNMPFGELDYEKIAALQPDLISGVYSGITEEEYETLSQIAPTIAQSDAYVDFGVPWQEMTLTIGQALGQTEQAEALVADVEGRFAAAREAHPEWQGKSVAVAGKRSDTGQYSFFASEDPRARLFTNLGFEVPAELDEVAGDQFYADISAERAALLDRDLLVWQQMQWVEGGRAEIEEDPLLQQLDAIQQGRYIFIEDDLDDALQFSTVLSLPYLLDDLAPMIEAALPAAAEAGAPSAGEETPAFPVTVEHKFGSSEIPSQPERVVTIGFSEQDPVLALGVMPVGVREWFGEQPGAIWPWAQEAAGAAAEGGQDTPEVLTMPFGELNFEAIAALQPDLIVATHSGITEAEYETLSQIAPTVAQSAEYPDFGMPWQEQTRLIGRALGRETQAETIVADVEAQITSTRDAHLEFEGATVAWASPATEQDQYWAVGPNTPPIRFLTSLGFQMPGALAEVVGDSDSAQISSEQLGLLDADVLILQVGSPEERAAIEDDPLFQQLDAAREGRSIFFVGLDDPVYGALSFSTVQSLPFALDELTPQLASAVDGS